MTTRTYVTLSEAIGATIEAVGESDSCIAIALSGDQYAFLCARQGWGDDGTGELEEDEPRLRAYDYPRGDPTCMAMVRAELWTYDELAELSRRRDQSDRAKQDHFERLTYERLKAKFDPPPGIDVTVPLESEGWIGDIGP